MSEEEEGGGSEAEVYDLADGVTEIPVVGEAFRRLLSSALDLPKRGAALLQWMGQFDLWSGDLSAMRGDEPPPSTPSTFTGHASPSAASLLDVLAVRKAFFSLDEHCRAAIRGLVIDRVTQSSDDIARRRLRSCVDRLQLNMRTAKRELASLESERVSGGDAARTLSELLHG